MKKCVLLLIFVLPILSCLPVQAAVAANSPALITEVQTGGDTISQEFIELHNQQNTSLTLDGWQLQYISASGKTTIPLVTLQGILAPNGDALISYAGYLANADATFTESSGSGLLAASAGHVQLLDNAQNQIDCISWGSSASAITGCDTAKTAPLSGQSIQRPVTDGIYDRALGVVIASPPNPHGGGLFLPDPPPVDPPGAPNDPAGATYPALQITELLPDPAAPQADASDEFIELYNPTNTPVNLGDYTLLTGLNNTYHFRLPVTTLAPHQYKAFYSRDTGLSLSNTSSKAQLLAPDGSVLSNTVAYENIGEGEAWALIDNTWQITRQPTPDMANILVAPEGQGSHDTSTSTDPTAEISCPEGKYRNPATNRCKNIEASSASLACDPGQVRNPATNRCRSTSATVATTTTCQSGYERNPDTNRCRKIATTSTSITACKQGYERNPETNRCRKAALTSTSHDSSSGDTTHSTLSKLTAKIIIGIVIVTIAYAIYEYRQEMTRLLMRLRMRLTPTSKPR